MAIQHKGGSVRLSQKLFNWNLHQHPCKSVCEIFTQPCIHWRQGAYGMSNSFWKISPRVPSRSKAFVRKYFTYLKVPKKNQSNNSWKFRIFLVYLFCGFCGVLSLVMWKVLTSRGFCGCFDDWQNHPGTRANQWHFNSTFLGKALSCAFLDTQVFLAPTPVSP